MLTPSELLQLHVCPLQATDRLSSRMELPAELIPDNRISDVTVFIGFSRSLQIHLTNSTSLEEQRCPAFPLGPFYIPLARDIIC